ncbi:hypothetical protein [Vibrio crassostreae]|uniref:hypothetical protein n=1 Tax=Vibrio crassostreae TaxID=246167 RepID=UPI00114F3EFD|nr:hypothetical protein [Vibrio crassostreae]
MKIHTLNGFEYHNTRDYFEGRAHWTYYFRPISEEQWFMVTQNAIKEPVYTVKKVHVLEFLSDAPLAEKYYYGKFFNMFDIATNKEKLLEAKAQVEYRREHPPRERADTHSNPRRLKRDMQRDSNWLSDAMSEVDRAQEKFNIAVEAAVSDEKLIRAKTKGNIRAKEGAKL